MHPLLEVEYFYLMHQGHDSFFYEPLTDTFYLLYWEGSLYNHLNKSTATFMNWRNDGLSIKHVIEYNVYTII